MIAPLTAGALLASCDDGEVLLVGPREPLRPGEETLVEATALAAANRAVPLALPAPQVNASWTHKGGSVRHSVPHPALGRTLTPVWAVDIGAGADKGHRVTADPVVAAGRVFTLDSRARVTAVTTSGAVAWVSDLTPPADRSGDASGGGLAWDAGTLYVASAFGTLTALDAATGRVRWEQDLDAAATGAPTVENGVVYVASRNAIGWAIDANDGRILWQVLGAPSASGIAGAPAPALSESLAIFPFGSGQMLAVSKSGGGQVWAASVAGLRPGRAFSRVSDLTGDPVISGTTVYAGNHSGRTAAFELVTGTEKWSADHGAMSPVWAGGNSVFLISDENRIVRLDAATGDTVWSVDLPFFTRQRLARRKGTFAHYGPVLAGGRLVVASDDALIRQFDPADGRLIGTVELPGGAASNPVVAGGTLYVVTKTGRLIAFR